MKNPLESGDVRPRVLIIYGDLLDYRVPIFTELGRHCDLTVSHSGRRMTDGHQGFTEVILTRRRLSRFHVQTGLRALIRKGKFDAIIFFMDIAWPMTVVNFLRPPYSTRRIIWGLWRTGHGLFDRIRMWLAKRADHNVFYSTGAAEDFIRRGLPRARVSIAHNTVHVKRPGRNEATVRDSFLVVGSFNARKQNDVALAAFVEASKKFPVPLRLVFVGDGAEREAIRSLAQLSGCAERIEFHPACHDEDMLRAFYDRAICSVSNGQAGLSVLQSFAYGVPFVTSQGAISGGEIENIVNGENGILTQGTQNSLEDVMLQLAQDAAKAAAMGQAALDYYVSRASARHMVGGFLEAIDPAWPGGVLLDDRREAA